MPPKIYTAPARHPVNTTFYCRSAMSLKSSSTASTHVFFSCNCRWKRNKIKVFSAGKTNKQTKNNKEQKQKTRALKDCLFQAWVWSEYSFTCFAYRQETFYLFIFICLPGSFISFSPDFFMTCMRAVDETCTYYMTTVVSPQPWYNP